MNGFIHSWWQSPHKPITFKRSYLSNTVNFIEFGGLFPTHKFQGMHINHSTHWPWNWVAYPLLSSRSGWPHGYLMAMFNQENYLWIVRGVNLNSIPNLIGDAQILLFFDIFSHFQAAFSCFRVLKMTSELLRELKLTHLCVTFYGHFKASSKERILNLGKGVTSQHFKVGGRCSGRTLHIQCFWYAFCKMQAGDMGFFHIVQSHSCGVGGLRKDRKSQSPSV